MIKYIEVKANESVPTDDAKYLWFDSAGITSSQDWCSYDEAKELIGFLYDSWLKPIAFDGREALDEAC